MIAAGLGTDPTPGSADKLRTDVLALLTTNRAVTITLRNKQRRKQKFCVRHCALVNINYTITVAMMRAGRVLPVAWMKHVRVTGE